jgi:hypothetical protein
MDSGYLRNIDASSIFPLQIIFLLIAIAVCVPALSDDGSAGGCPVTIQDQVALYANTRARELKWPLVKVVLESRTRIIVGESSSDDVAHDVVNNMIAISLADSTIHVTLSRIGDQPAADKLKGEYYSVVRQMLEKHEAFTAKLRWYFRGLPPFETTALFTSKPAAAFQNLLFEPILDVDGSSWKRVSWRKTCSLPSDSPFGCVWSDYMGPHTIKPKPDEQFCLLEKESRGP